MRKTERKTEPIPAGGGVGPRERVKKKREERTNPFPSLRKSAKQERNAHIVRLSQEGLPTSVIAARCGISSRMVLEVLRKHRKPRPLHEK